MQAQAHHPGFGPQFSAGHVPQLLRRTDAPQPAPTAQAPADTPEVLHGGLLEPAGGLPGEAEVEDPGVLPIPLGDVVRHFGQHLAGGETDGNGQTQVVADPAAQGRGPGDEVTVVRPGQADEGFIDRIDLQLGDEGLQAAHQPMAHVAIEGVVGAAHDDTVPLELVGDLEVGLAHANAELPGLTAAGDHAAVVVGEHHDGAAEQCWIEGLLTAGIEVVGIDQPEGISHGRRGCEWRGSPHPRSGRRRSGAVRAGDRRCWRPRAATGLGGGRGASR